MKMSHEKDEVMAALAFLDTFSHDADYKDKLTIIYDYFSDLVELVAQSQEQARKATTLLMQSLQLNENREGRRKLQKMLPQLQVLSACKTDSPQY